MNVQLDLEKDILDLQRIGLLNTLAEEESYYLLQVLEQVGGEIDTPRVSRAFHVIQANPVHNVSSTSYSELISSGNIRLLKDQRLKRGLFEYYEFDPWVVGYIDRMDETIREHFTNRVISYVDPLLFKEARKYLIRGLDTYEKADLSGFHIDWKMLRRDKDLIPLIKLMISDRHFRAITQQGRLNMAEAILSGIKHKIQNERGEI